MIPMHYSIIELLLFFLTLRLSQVFRAQLERMWWSNEDTKLWQFFNWLGLEQLRVWYKGHHSLFQCFWPRCPWWLRYNPSLPLPLSPFTDDCWHHIKKLEYASYAVMCGILAQSWLVAILVYVLLGVFFFIDHHRTVVRRGSRGWWAWSKLITFWRSHWS